MISNKIYAVVISSDTPADEESYMVSPKLHVYHSEEEFKQAQLMVSVYDDGASHWLQRLSN